MCGIAGILNIDRKSGVSPETLRSMAAILHHRGPDGCGYYNDGRIGLAHARLSIIDLEGGWQPIHNEDKSLWITFNGEIFNYIELREDLVGRGHSFYTRSDTEVIIHLYEDYGADCLKYLNGQFAFAIWDNKTGSLFLARDRVGIRPLFYTMTGGAFIFASEVKSIFMDKRVKREIDLFAMDQIFSFWMTISPRTAFKDILELPAGNYMKVEGGKIEIKQYWDPEFAQDYDTRSEAELAEELRGLLIDSTRLRLRADVPVGAYLSGGIDSSVITTIIKKFTSNKLRTFSVAFSDEIYDESEHQKEMIEYLNTDHSEIRCSYTDIGSVFREIIWHTEKPVLRTAPTPLYLLSKLVRESGYKVVLTGEGSDEILAGYDIFKEAKVRKFMARDPKSAFRSSILRRLYPYLENSPTRSLQYAGEFFNVDHAGYPPGFYSHIPRWNMTSKIKMFFSDDVKEKLTGYNNLDDLSAILSNDFDNYDLLSQAQYTEIKTLLSGYLLSSQGDRVAMANSIEGRFPFLDHRVVEFCCKLPPNVRMKTLTEKYLLKESMRDFLPESIIKRTKQPYMAPDSKSFFGGGPIDYLQELLSARNVETTGYFNPKSVSILIKKCRNRSMLGFKDNMAIVGIISTLLLHDLYIEKFNSRSADIIRNTSEDEKYAVKI